MAATVPKPRRRTRTTAPAGRLTLRLGQQQVAFLAAEAGKARLPIAEHVRNLIARGMQARELQETVAEVSAMLSELRAPVGGGIEGLALEALLEVRAIAAVRDPLIVTNAREEARKELAALRANK